MSTRKSSRQQFEQHQQDVRERRKRGEELPPSGHSTQVKSRKRARSTRELIVCFFQLLKGQRAAVGFSVFTLTIATSLALIPPATTKFIVDYVLGEKPVPPEFARFGLPSNKWDLLLIAVGVVLGITLLKVLVHISGRWVATRATKRMQMSIRRRVFEHAVRLPLSRVQELRSGGVASILREDAGSVGQLIFGMIYNPWRAAVQLVGSLCILAWVDWQLLLGALVLLPLVYFTHRTWINRIRPQYRDIRNQRETIDGQATESFGGMRVVRAFSRQRTESLRYMKANHLMGRLELCVWWWSRTIEIIWETLIPISSAGMLLYGGYQVLNDQLTLGDLTMFLVYLLMLLQPLAVLAQSAAQFQNSLSGLDRVLDLLAESRETPVNSSAIQVRAGTTHGALSFDSVTFRYPGSSNVALEDVNLNIRSGETVALVGPSGAGKTTLCNLVARFYDPDEGTVCLDGTDLRELDVESFRRLLGVVEQDVFLFDGSVIDNISYSVRETELLDVEHAAKIANAHDFISELPDGYETIIGERGVKLSGGQRQRIAIARAVLANPRILILDEATSNLDTQSERLIQTGLKSLMKGRTCIVIAHRLSTIVDADRIVVLDEGKIIQIGSHHELLASEGPYRSMVASQTGTNAELLADSWQ
ncbi:MAG: ABC transporter ATP-binding protein [Planctomycetaceae bacterium]|nr:ABC transporter ATP-binding protein [Planctomycetaceae bacterium]